MLIIRQFLTLSFIVLISLNIQAQLSFTGINQLPPLYNPYGSVSADFNGDGKLDLAIVNSGSNTISVFTGSGTGLFGASINYTAASGAKNIVAGTLNGDNFPDLVVTDYDADSITVFINQGNGLFATGVNYATGSGPNDLAIGDFNNDNKLDLAIANYNTHYLSILTNTGTGSFSPAPNRTTAGYPYSVAVGDFNADNKKDLAVVFYYDDSFSVLTGTGTGTFGSERIYGTSSAPSKVAAADFNSDGKQDVVVTNYGGSGYISVFTGTGSGTLGVQKDYATTGSSISSCIGDFNVDGKMDVAVSNNDAHSISLFINSGTGTLNPKTDYPTGASSQSLISGDFNSDGVLDIVVPNNDNNNFVLLTNSGAGTFDSKVNFGTGANPTVMVSADFDGDGKIDVATTNYDNNTISVAFNTGNGKFGRVDNYFSTGSNPWGIASADFNNDGKPDLVYANNYDGNISVLLNSGNGQFTFSATYTVGTNPVEVVVGDLNGDSKPDIAVGNYTSNNISVLLNAGNGLFGGTNNYTAGTSSRSLILGNFNNDDKPDLAVANYGETSISILMNNGSGAFPTQTPYTVDYSPYCVSAADINGDNKTDLIVCYSYSSGSVSTHINNGDGTLGTPSYHGTGSYPLNVTIGDFNGDGKNDIVTSNSSDNNVSILVNNGNQSFTRIDKGSIDEPQYVIVNDFNGDTRPDILTANNNKQYYLSLLLNANKYLTITVNDASKAYNSPNPAFTSTVIGLMGGDQVIVTYTTTATQTSIPGQYPIIPIISFIGSNFSSYALTTIAGTLTIDAVTPDLTYTGATSGAVDASIILGAQSNSTGIISYTVTNGTGTAEIIANSLKLNTVGTVTLFVNITSVLGFNATSIQVPITISASAPPTTTTGTSTVPGSTIPGNGTGTIIVTGNNIVNIYIWGTATGSNLANTTATGGTQSSINTSVALASGVSADSVRVYFREISSKGAFTKIGGSQNSNTYTASLDPAAITSLGLEYYFEISQGATKFYTDTLYVYLNFNSKIAIGTQIKTGSTIKDYQILSLPYVFTSTKVTDVLNELGAVDKSQWRLFGYENGSSVEKNADDDISQPGKGYWLITKKGLTDFNSNGKVPTVRKSNPVTIFMNKGWNLLGNPYTFNVLWQDVIDANAGKTLPTKIYTYDQTGIYVVSTSLPKFSGAWVYMADTATIKIPVVKNNSVNSGRLAFETLPGNVSTDNGWEATIEVNQGAVNYKLSGIGMYDDATDKIDSYDIHVLPRLPQYADISMVSSDNQLLTRSIVKSSDKYTWNMTLNSDNAEVPASLSWNLPSGVSLILEDGSGNKVNMSQINKVDVKPGSNFRILYGSTEDGNGISISSPQPNPSTDHILLNVSLPEDGIVETKIIGLTGTLEQSEKKILSQGVNSFYISTVALSQGFHLLQINVTSGAKTYSKTFKIVTSK